MEQEHKDELAWEEANIQRDEKQNIWLKDNWSYLSKEFIKEHEDEFVEFCNEEFKYIGDD